MQDPGKFWNRMANRYAKSPVADEAAYQKKLEITREYLNTDMNLLEFGCGTGSTAIVHAPFVKHILATDVSSRMLEIAQAKADEAGVTNITFERVGMDEFSAPDSSFDVVLGLSILHLLADLDATIAKVFALLKRGGVFVSSTPCLGDSLSFFKFIGPIGTALGLLPLLRVFSVAELDESLSKAGFTIERSWKPQKSHAVFIVAKKPG